MTIVIIILAVFLSSTHANAQENSTADGISFTKGTKVAQIGIALGGSFGAPIGASVEVGITEKIGVGAYLGYASKTYPVLANEYKVSNMLIGARGHYHFYNTDKIDAYGGVILGYNVATAKWKTNTNILIPASYGGVIYAGLIGGRYYFTDKIAGFAELGYGIGFLSVGVAAKF